MRPRATGRDPGNTGPTRAGSACSCQYLQAQDAVTRRQDGAGESARNRAVGDVGDLDLDLLARVATVDVVVFLEDQDIADLEAFILAHVVELMAGLDRLEEVGPGLLE